MSTNFTLSPKTLASLDDYFSQIDLVSQTREPYLRNVIKGKEAEISALKDEVARLSGDLDACKEFFGYDADMTLDQMQEYKEDCEEEDKALRETDQEYDEECKKSEEIVDLVVRMGEYEYAVSEIHGKLRELGGEDITRKRKALTASLLALRESLPEENIEEFFRLVRELVDLHEKIHATDKLINLGKY